jgi:hypothetical protein
VTPGRVPFAIALLGFLPACGEKDIPVATIADSEAPEAAAVPCTELDAGISDCPDGSFCSVTSCGSTGTCEPIPAADSCANAAYDPECGCDGVTYFNPCLRNAAGVSGRGPGATCAEKCGTLPPPEYCFPRTTATDCARKQTWVVLAPSYISNVPGSPGIPTFPDGGFGSPDEVCRGLEGLLEANFGFCWVLPDTCPSSGSRPTVSTCTSPSACLDACMEFKREGVYFACP